MSDPAKKINDLLTEVQKVRQLQAESEGEINFGLPYERYLAAAVNMDWKSIEGALKTIQIILT